MTTQPSRQYSGRLAVLTGVLTIANIGGCTSPEESSDIPHVATTTSDLRPTDPNAGPLSFRPLEFVETLESEKFKVHFTTAGINAIPTADSDGSGAPDYAEFVLATYEAALAVYTEELGFLPPIDDLFIDDGNGGDGKFDIYLLDFGGRGNGQFVIDGCLPDAPTRCAGHMIQENDFAGSGYPSTLVATSIVGSHELFHAVQAAHAAQQDVIVSEATAVWATERYDPGLNDFEAFVGIYLERPERSLFVAPAGIADGYPYSVSLFFKYLDETLGPEVVLKLWQQLETAADDDWLAALDEVLRLEYAGSFGAAFEEFAVWNMYTAGRANPSLSYLEGARYPPVAAEPALLPYQAVQLRLFAASARYWSFAPGARATVTATLAGGPGEPTDGLALRIVPVTAAGAGESVAVATLRELPTAGVDSFLLAAINPASSGTSRRATLCAGTRAEVEACLASVVPSDTDAGVVGPPDGGFVAVDAGVAPTPSGSGDGGCTSHRVSHGWSSPFVVLLLIGLLPFSVRRVRRGLRSNRPH